MYGKVIQLWVHVHILFHILFHYGLLQGIESSSLCCTVGPRCLSILYIVACMESLFSMALYLFPKRI